MEEDFPGLLDYLSGTQGLPTEQSVAMEPATASADFGGWSFDNFRQQYLAGQQALNDFNQYAADQAEQDKLFTSPIGDPLTLGMLPGLINIFGETPEEQAIRYFQLQSRDTKVPITFNPWEYSGGYQLVDPSGNVTFAKTPEELGALVSQAAGYTGAKDVYSIQGIRSDGSVDTIFDQQPKDTLVDLLVPMALMAAAGFGLSALGVGAGAGGAGAAGTAGGAAAGTAAGAGTAASAGTLASLAPAAFEGITVLAPTAGLGLGGAAALGGAALGTAAASGLLSGTPTPTTSTTTPEVPDVPEIVVEAPPPTAPVIPPIIPPVIAPPPSPPVSPPPAEVPPTEPEIVVEAPPTQPVAPPVPLPIVPPPPIVAPPPPPPEVPPTEPEIVVEAPPTEPPVPPLLPPIIPPAPPVSPPPPEVPPTEPEIVVEAPPTEPPVPPLLPPIIPPVPPISTPPPGTPPSDTPPGDKKEDTLLTDILRYYSLGSGLLDALGVGQGGGATPTTPYTSLLGPAPTFGRGAFQPFTGDYEQYGFGPEWSFFAPSSNTGG